MYQAQRQCLEEMHLMWPLQRPSAVKGSKSRRFLEDLPASTVSRTLPLSCTLTLMLFGRRLEVHHVCTPCRRHLRKDDGTSQKEEGICLRGPKGVAKCTPIALIISLTQLPASKVEAAKLAKEAEDAKAIEDAETMAAAEESDSPFFEAFNDNPDPDI